MKSPYVNGIMGLVLVGIAALGSYFLFHDHDANVPNRTIINDFVFDPPVDQLVAGEEFKVRVHTTIRRPCPFQIRWSLVDEKNEEVYRSIEPVRTRPKAEVPVDEVHPHFIAAHVKPGRYLYEAQIFDLCPGVRASLVIQPAIPVIVH
jgi:hypothetical protein